MVVAGFALAGTAAGWLWFRLWDPPMGGVVDGRWLYESFAAVGSDFDATGLFVVIGVGVCLLLGVAAALVCRRSELVTLLAVASGSLLAAWCCFRVGMELRPFNPRLLAPFLPDGTTLPDTLTMSGTSPFLMWPVAGLVGLSATYFVTAVVADVRRRDTEDPRWLRVADADRPPPVAGDPADGTLVDDQDESLSLDQSGPPPPR